MKTLKIKSITRRPYKGDVYNLHLDSKDIDNDDLYWVEQESGIVSHNCFPKDINAMISLFEEHGLDAKQMKATWEQNKAIRDNWDWAKISGAVSEK